MIAASTRPPRGRLGAIGLGLLLVMLGGLASLQGAPEPSLPTLRLGAPLSLADCIRLAHEKKPALVARRASLKDAEEYSQSLAEKRMALLASDLTVRRRQATLGVQYAKAALLQAECETTHAVTREYLTVLHIRRRQEILHQTVEDLQKRLVWLHQELKRSSRPNLNPGTLQQVTDNLKLAQARQQEADQGLPRALAALREVLGVGPDFTLDIPNAPLPAPQVQVQPEEILSLAQGGRADLIQAVTLAEITHLEVEAQDELRFRPNTKTFAAYLDCTAPPAPIEPKSPDTRPSVIALQMPKNLCGYRSARVEQVKAAGVKADALVEKVRNQVTLEANDAFRAWRGEARKLTSFLQAEEQAESAAESVDRDFARAAPGVNYEHVLTAVVLAHHFQARSAESHFHYALSLAELQRVTSGGFVPGFETAAPAAPALPSH